MGEHSDKAGTVDMMTGIALSSGNWKVALALQVARPAIAAIVQAIGKRAADRGLLRDQDLETFEAMAERIIQPQPGGRQRVTIRLRPKQPGHRRPSS